MKLNEFIEQFVDKNSNLIITSQWFDKEKSSNENEEIFEGRIDSLKDEIRSEEGKFKIGCGIETKEEFADAVIKSLMEEFSKYKVLRIRDFLKNYWKKDAIKESAIQIFVQKED